MRYEKFWFYSKEFCFEKWTKKYRNSWLQVHAVNRSKDVLSFLALKFCLRQTQRSFWMPLSMTAGITNPSITQWCLVYTQCKGQRSYCRSHPLYWLVVSHWELLGNQCSATCPGNINVEGITETRPESKCLATQRKKNYDILIKCHCDECLCLKSRWWK